MEQPVNKSNKNQLLVQILLFIVFFAIAFFGTKYLFSKDIGAELQQITTEMNKTLPMKVDAETRLDNTQYIAPKTVQYNYTVLAANSDSLVVDLSELKKYLQENSQKLLDTAPEMKLFRENEVTMKYYYKDKNGKHLLDFTVTPATK